MLDAGIDVFSTLNIQHLESLNDQVAELTGVRVRETVPDQVLAARRRGRPHRPHRRRRCSTACARARSTRPERIDAALNNFFRIENLAALREIALRQVAEDVEAKRLSPPSRWARGEEQRRERGAARPSASACSRWSSPSPARSDWCAAPGAPPSASAPTSTSSGSSRRAEPRPRSRSASSRRCASWLRCSARTSW